MGEEDEVEKIGPVSENKTRKYSLEVAEPSPVPLLPNQNPDTLVVEKKGWRRYAGITFTLAAGKKSTFTKKFT